MAPFSDMNETFIIEAGDVKEAFNIATEKVINSAYFGKIDDIKLIDFD